MHSEHKMEELVAVAKIVRTRGLRGEVIADVLTDFPERFDELEDVTGLLPSGERAKLKIENFWFQKDRIVLKFAGYDSVESAETLRNTEICVADSDVVELGEGEYFEWELAGCAVETIEGEKVGIVEHLLRTGGTEVLVIRGDDKEYLIPFAETICVDVDIENKLIRIDPPEGLLEF